MNAIILDNKKGGTSSASKNFGGIRYNINKMDTGKGELMALRNFGALGSDTVVEPAAVKQYLSAVAKLNPNKEKKQFHAVISCKGKEYDKNQLTDVAHDWMDKMGYANNPYIVVFHNDTENNHVHIVSVRVDINTGKSIPDAFENVRAVKNIDQSMKEKYGIDRKAEKLDFSDYRVTTLPQFKLLYEITGHTAMEVNGKLKIMKEDRLNSSFDLNGLAYNIGKNKEDDKRKNQLKAILSKYLPDFEGALHPVHQKLSGDRKGNVVGYKSDFTEFMRERFGLQFVFHHKENQPPYGYTIVDHKAKAVFKGSGVMKLTELTRSPDHKVKLTYLEKKLLDLNGYNSESLSHMKILAKKFKVPLYRIPVSDRKISDVEKAYYKDLLALFLRDHHISALKDINMEAVREDGKWYVLDNGSKTILDADEILAPDEIQSLDHEHGLSTQNPLPNIDVLNPFSGIAAIAGTITPDREDKPKRRKKKKI